MKSITEHSNLTLNKVMSMQSMPKVPVWDFTAMNSLVMVVMITGEAML